MPPSAKRRSGAVAPNPTGGPAGPTCLSSAAVQAVNGAVARPENGSTLSAQAVAHYILPGREDTCGLGQVGEEVALLPLPPPSREAETLVAASTAQAPPPTTLLTFKRRPGPMVELTLIFFR
jgi:hypothetical protein